MFKNWAQPVVSKPWGIVTVAAFWVSKRSGYRVLNGFKGHAHRKSGGLTWE